MCLYIRNKKPRVAKRNIVVLKYLSKKDNKFYSPCQGAEVKLGEVLKAYPTTPNISNYNTDVYNRRISSLKGGAIHAKLCEDNEYGNYCAKAIIPKGTKYWLNSFGTEIAAERMLITEEKGNNDVIDNSLAREILATAPEVNGVRIGDYQLIDDSFIHPKKSIAKTKVRGIVCGFYENGNPIICALEVFLEVWDEDCDSKIGNHISYSEAMRLFNGKGITRKYIKKKYKDKSRYGAFERCINYRKDTGEKWFFGSLGETMIMLDNAIYLNAAHKITGFGFVFNDTGRYWSCSEASYSCFWYCNLFGYSVCCYWSYKNHVYRVVPFYDSTKTI